MLAARIFAPCCCARGLVLRSVAPGAPVRRVPAGTSPSGMHGPIPVLSIVEHALIRARPYVFGQAALGVAPVAHPTAMAAMRALSGSVASRSMMLPPSPPGRPGARGVATAAAPSAGAGDGAGEQERVFDTEEGPQDRAMGIWLLGVSGMVAGMVVLGGLTRLTGSGLSMTKWRPHSEMPPMTQEEWEAEFEEFKTFPEYQMKRKYENFTLEEFKFIYFMEWSHRYAGRITGLGFALPLTYFVARGRVSRQLGKRLGLLFALGGAQGLVGWWMVRSGLQKDKMDVDRAEDWQLNTQFASVSPYRLTSHLTSAFVIYVLLFWTGLSLLDGRRVASASPVTAKRLSRLSALAHAATGMAGVTVFSGGFVAGNHAGLAYNDWPYMGGRFVPSDVWDERLGWRNFTENIPTVQFDHRMLAYATTTVATAASLTAFSLSSVLPARVTLAAAGLTAAVLGQVGLGIATLMGGVPIHLASPHQAGAIVVLSAALTFMHTLRKGAPRFLLTQAKAKIARAPVARPPNS